MRAIIKCKDGVSQEYLINPKNVSKLQDKYKDRIKFKDNIGRKINGDR